VIVVVVAQRSLCRERRSTVRRDSYARSPLGARAQSAARDPVHERPLRDPISSRRRSSVIRWRGLHAVALLELTGSHNWGRACARSHCSVSSRERRRLRRVSSSRARRTLPAPRTPSRDLTNTRQREGDVDTPYLPFRAWRRGQIGDARYSVRHLGGGRSSPVGSGGLQPVDRALLVGCLLERTYRDVGTWRSRSPTRGDGGSF